MPSTSATSLDAIAASFFQTTQASGRSLHFGSGIAITAASATFGCAISAFSRSTDEIHSPPDLIRSLVRSVMRTVPSASIAATSPVRSHPSSVNFSSVTGTPWYEPVMNGPRTWISPTDLASHGASSPSSARMRTSTSGTGTPAIAARRNCSFSGSDRSRTAVVASGEVSVMPQPWTIQMSCFAKARINASGTAAPPTSERMPAGSFQRPGCSTSERS